MTTASARHDAGSPVRDGSRYGSASPEAGANGRSCPLCGAALSFARARYCSDACKQRAYRLRRAASSPPSEPSLATALRRQPQGVAHTIYVCSSCEQRFLAERRCDDCNRFCRSLGLGGLCPHCDEPVLLAELFDLEVLPMPGA